MWLLYPVEIQVNVAVLMGPLSMFSSHSRSKPTSPLFHLSFPLASSFAAKGKAID